VTHVNIKQRYLFPFAFIRRDVVSRCKILIRKTVVFALHRKVKTPFSRRFSLRRGEPGDLRIIA
jgi:hypothetical protein